MIVRARFALLLMLVISHAVVADFVTFEFQNELQQKRFQSLIGELRCPKCQNQSLADSDAEISQDLKLLVYEMLQQNRSDDEIRSYLIERYGDFISYKPPVRMATAALWFGPVLVLMLALLLAAIKIIGRNKNSRRTDSLNNIGTSAPLNADRLTELRRQLDSTEQNLSHQEAIVDNNKRNNNTPDNRSDKHV